ncbi:MAG: aldehyde dehydrogenase family protein [Bacilli bacterium]
MKSFFMDGVWHEKEVEDAAVVTVRNPWNGEAIFRYAEPASDEISEIVESAVLAARRGALGFRDRAAILERTSELLAAHAESMARTLTLETGKPIRDARQEVGRAVKNFRLASEEAARIHGYTEVQENISDDDAFSLTLREPLGVVCAITPFNFPLNVAALKIAPALAAGNAVILKPADATPMTAMRLLDLMVEAGLPNGYLNMVLGGARSGQDLVSDPRIALYTFTGSVAVGRRIKEQSGVRPVILELGSNSPNMVHGDADLDLAVESLAKAAFAYAGQVCISAQRIYVQESIWSDFLGRFVARVKQLCVGDPMDESTDIGPLITEQAAVRVEEWINDAVAGGATALTQGKRRGSLLDPVILTDVRPDMAVVCREAFGPVVSVIPYRSVEEAIALCNESEFGLQAGVFTGQLDVAFAVARGLHVGGVNINQASNMRADSMPYGGVKNSGIGKEGARASIDEMTATKVITIRHKRAHALS